MDTIWLVVIIAVVAIGAVYAIYGIKLKKSPDMPQIICANTNCGYKGEPRRKKQFSVIVFLGLSLLWLLPGIVYAILVPQYKYWCPECKAKLSV